MARKRPCPCCCTRRSGSMAAPRAKTGCVSWIIWTWPGTVCTCPRSAGCRLRSVRLRDRCRGAGAGARIMRALPVALVRYRARALAGGVRDGAGARSISCRCDIGVGAPALIIRRFAREEGRVCASKTTDALQSRRRCEAARSHHRSAQAHHPEFPGYVRRDREPPSRQADTRR